MKIPRSAPLVLTVVALALFPTVSMAATDSFSLSYNVERVGAQKMDVGKCLDTARSAADALGYVGTVSDRHADKLAVYGAGPSGGGASLVVYCIAVDTKTTFVVQAIDYRNNAARAKLAADTVYKALLENAK